MKIVNIFSLKKVLAVTLGLLLFNSVYLLTDPCCDPSLTDFLISSAEGEPFQEVFVSIQQAINEAENGSIVYVPSGVYHEQIVINKTISLVGENVSTAIIDGNNAGTVVQIVADNVTISGFTVKNSGWGWYKNGIYVYRADNCEIRGNFLFNNCHNIRLNCSRDSRILDNTIEGTGYGIRLISSFNCTANGNNVSDCIGGVHLQNATSCVVRRNRFAQNSQGIRLYSPCAYNKITANTVYNNTYEGMMEAIPENTTFVSNFFFHNNFLNNKYPFIYKVSGNVWDDGYPSGGNYWSKCNATDFFSGPNQNETGSDGIGDAPYAVNTFDSDRYPLIHPYGAIRNRNTNLIYLTIQSAIDASETLDGHTLWVDSGIYCEHLNIGKSLMLVGENPKTTIIDGENTGTVLSISADNVSVVRFTIRNSGVNVPPYGNDCGVFLNRTVGSNISHNLVTENRIGIYLFFSKGNAIERNVVSSNHENGIWLWYSGNNILAENEISSNSYNFGVFGGSFSDFNNTIDVSNTVDGKPIQYIIGGQNEIFDNQTNTGVLYIINCINVTVRNLNLTKNGHGVFCFNITNSKIENVTALENNYGIYLQDSTGNVIGNNRCLRNWVGIYLQDSNHNVVENNTAGNGEKGISLYEAHNNNLRDNNVVNSLYGVRLYSSHSNEVFHNNLIENTEQVSLISSYQNAWDNGFEGNFWSNYVGSDINRDGLGDIHQIIDYDNRDHFPLLGTFHNFTVCHEREFHGITVISNSTILNFVFEASNNTIRLTVNGTNETYGFCRISIPHILVEPELIVIIDDGLTEVFYSNLTLNDDGFRRWIYFMYQHSIHEILIIPEFWPLTFLSTLVIATLLVAFIKNRCARFA